MRDARIGADEKAGAREDSGGGGKIEPAAEVKGAGGAGDRGGDRAVLLRADEDAREPGAVAQGGGERGVAVRAPALARNRPARMQRDKALRETVGREREAFGGDRARPRQEGDGRNAERGGEDATELCVLWPLQIVGDRVRVEAETGGGDVEAHAERGTCPGGEDSREVVELLRVEDGGIVAAA